MSPPAACMLASLTYSLALGLALTCKDVASEGAGMEGLGVMELVTFENPLLMLELNEPTIFEKPLFSSFAGAAVVAAAMATDIATVMIVIEALFTGHLPICLP